MKMRLSAALLAALALSLALAGGASARTVPQGFFGVAYDGPFADAPPERQSEQFDLMAQSGVESVRLLFAWETMQPRRRMKPDFSRMDVKVALAAQRGIEILPQVLYAPYWARKYRRRTHSPPKRTKDYARFVRAAIRRYGPKGSFWKQYPQLPVRPIRQWQLWNEPGLRSYWDAPRKSSYGWPHGYGRLLRGTNKVIKKEDPGAKTIFAGLTGVAWLEMRRAYRHGRVRGHFNVAALQIYPQTVRREIEAVRHMRQEMARAGDRRRSLYITEVAFPASKGRTKPIKGQRQQTPQGMASRLADLYDELGARRRRYKLERIYWYSWSTRYLRRRSNFEFSGLLRSRYGTVYRIQPALDAFTSSAQAAQGCIKSPKWAYCLP